MSTEQLKNLVIDQISGIGDKEFLQAIKTILDANAHAHDVVFKTTKQQKEKIKAGLNQLKEKNTITNTALEKEEYEWLRKA